MGCWKDEPSPWALDGSTRSDMWEGGTTTNCADMCQARGYLFFATTNSHICFCGDEYQRYGRANETECKPCMGSVGDTARNNSCGSFFRNSIYRINYEQRFTPAAREVTYGVDTVGPVREMHVNNALDCYSSHSIWGSLGTDPYSCKQLCSIVVTTVQGNSTDFRVLRHEHADPFDKTNSVIKAAEPKTDLTRRLVMRSLHIEVRPIHAQYIPWAMYEADGE